MLLLYSGINYITPKFPSYQPQPSFNSLLSYRTFLSLPKNLSLLNLVPTKTTLVIHSTLELITQIWTFQALSLLVVRRLEYI